MFERVALDAIDDPARVSAVLATGLLDTPAERAFDDLAALGSTLTGLPLAFVTFVDAERSYWKAAFGTGIAAEDTLRRQNPVSDSFCQYVIRADAPVIITDASVDPRCRDNPSVISMGVRAWAGFPVRDPSGRVLGSFCVMDTVAREFAARDLEVLATLADAATREVALRAATSAAEHLNEELTRAQQRLRWQVAASEALGSTLDPVRIVTVLTSLIVPCYGMWAVVACPTAVAATEFDVTGIGGTDGVQVVHAHCAGPDAARLEGVLRAFPFSTEDAAGPGRVMATGSSRYQPQLRDLVGIRFARATPAQVEQLTELAPAAGGAASFPLRGAERVLAALSVGAPAGGELDRELLADLARRAGTALDNALSYHRERRGGASARARARHQRLLARAAQALHRRLDPLAELQELARSTVPELADFSSVHLLHRPVPPGVAPDLPVITDRVATQIIEGMDPPTENQGLIWSADTDPIPETIRHGGLLRAPIPAPQVPDWAANTGSTVTFRSGLNQVVLAPVVVDGLVVAVASFGMCHRRPGWSPQDLDTLEEITRYAGIALGNGLAYKRSRDSALVLQGSMLSEPPQVDGLEFCVRYRPAGHDQVGGDWYDVFELPDGQIGIVVGDVVGHDITAAAAMGQLRAALRSLAVDGDRAPATYRTGPNPSSPGALLERLAQVNRQLRMTPFATVIYGQMRRTEGGWWLRWCSAGHPPPLLVTCTGEAQVLIGSSRPPVHATSGTPRQLSGDLVQRGSNEQDTFIPLGATLLLYTDGLIERRGVDLNTAISTLAGQASDMTGADLPDLCDHLVAAAGTEDDLALLALRVLPIHGPGTGHQPRETPPGG